VDGDGLLITVDVELDAEALEAVDHDQRVVGEEAVGEGAGTVRHRREDQGAVREALGAGGRELRGEGLSDKLKREFGHGYGGR
jgi:hypothetical protein